MGNNSPWNISMTIRVWACALLTVLIGWIGLQLVVMRFSDAAPGAIVLFSDDAFIGGLPDDIAVLDIGAYWVAVKADEPRLAARLYNAGAWLVLPAGLPGCLPLPAQGG